MWGVGERFVPPAKYKVQGVEFSELALAEIQARALLNRGEKEVVIFRGDETYEVWQKKNGTFECSKFR